MSFSSGLPLGLVLTAIPAWLAMAEVDIKTIGWFSMAQMPWAFKFVWAPLLDRFRLPFLSRHRDWVFVFQFLLGLSTFALGFFSNSMNVWAIFGLTLLISFVSASQDIAVDAYTVEVLHKNEQGLAVGARTALYRTGMWLAGNISISLAPVWGWQTTLWAQAFVYFALLAVTVFSPKAPTLPHVPASLWEAVWKPVASFLSHPRALEVSAFLFFYKLADNLAASLVRPFLVEKGYSAIDVGIASGTVGLFATLGGTFLGGLLTRALGVGRALWVFGFLQALSNVGYAWVAQYDVNRGLLYSAIGVEAATTGLGTGAFSVLLLRITQKQFSATQFALFSSIFALGRSVVGPWAGTLVASMGWTWFFYFTVPCALPGLLLLHRFAPWAQKDIPEMQ